MNQEPIIKDAVDYDDKLDFDEEELNQDFDDDEMNVPIKLKSLNQLKWDDDDEYGLERHRVANKLKEDPEKAGEAALHGIYFEDQNEYDYMKHLKTVENVPGSYLFDSSSKIKTKLGGIAFKVGLMNALN